jgi:hypothetical protein
MNRLKSQEGDVQHALNMEFRQFNLGRGRIAQNAAVETLGTFLTFLLGLDTRLSVI